MYTSADINFYFIINLIEIVRLTYILVANIILTV